MEGKIQTSGISTVDSIDFSEDTFSLEKYLLSLQGAEGIRQIQHNNHRLIKMHSKKGVKFNVLQQVEKTMTCFWASRKERTWLPGLEPKSRCILCLREPLNTQLLAFSISKTGTSPHGSPCLGERNSQMISLYSILNCSHKALLPACFFQSYPDLSLCSSSYLAPWGWQCQHRKSTVQCHQAFGEPDGLGFLKPHWLHPGLALVSSLQILKCLCDVMPRARFSSGSAGGAESSSPWQSGQGASREPSDSSPVPGEGRRNPPCKNCFQSFLGRGKKKLFCQETVAIPNEQGATCH